MINELIRTILVLEIYGFPGILNTRYLYLPFLHLDQTQKKA